MGSQQSQIFQKDFKSQFFPNLYCNNLSTLPSLPSFSASLEQSYSNNGFTRQKTKNYNENNKKDSLKINAYQKNNQNQQNIEQYFNQMRTSSIDLYSQKLMLQLSNKNKNKQNYVLNDVQGVIFKKNVNKISQNHNEQFSYEGESMQDDQQQFFDLKSLHILKSKKEAKKIFVSSLFNKMAIRGNNSQGYKESFLHQMARVQISPTKKQKTVNNSCIKCDKLVDKIPCILVQNLNQQQLQFNNYNDCLIKENNKKF